MNKSEFLKLNNIFKKHNCSNMLESVVNKEPIINFICELMRTLNVLDFTKYDAKLKQVCAILEDLLKENNEEINKGIKHYFFGFNNLLIDQFDPNCYDNHSSIILFYSWVYTKRESYPLLISLIDELTSSKLKTIECNCVYNPTSLENDELIIRGPKEDNDMLFKYTDLFRKNQFNFVVISKAKNRHEGYLSLKHVEGTDSDYNAYVDIYDKKVEAKAFDLLIESILGKKLMYNFTVEGSQTYYPDVFDYQIGTLYLKVNRKRKPLIEVLKKYNFIKIGNIKDTEYNYDIYKLVITPQENDKDYNLDENELTHRNASYFYKKMLYYKQRGNQNVR